MPIKPSSSEEEYFARQEMERRRKLAAEQDKAMAAEDREKARAAHFMRCPKCGSQLEEITFGGVCVDKCFRCEGIWLDKGEIDEIRNGGEGFLRQFFGVFRPGG
jgi:hypothetical protein